MKERRKSTSGRNSTPEITPEEARKKRARLLELARKEAEASEASREAGDPDDSLATFILPGD
jgi:hypothetical protein